MTLFRPFCLALALASLASAASAQQAFDAGPIWDQNHANQVCPAVAASHGGTWTGHWWTTVPNQMSVCQVQVASPAIAVEAGPIWNQNHANQVCPRLAASIRGTWTGQWWTTQPSVMSVCQIIP
ncbi:mannan-binding lectin [Jannaschia sp. CCS1]|uniref:mannan-binding lectin n=1 Tax=Jannaschia sp. (strain CCS1) TaxID=290400 RepID=UPI00140FC51A|nr:mannan-binding lectin [Jannaschia sp. CCS1]